MNTEVKKVKHTSTGVEVVYETEKSLADDVISKVAHTVKCKETPHPDLSKALQAFKEIVMFDEGLPKKAEIEVTGVTYFPSNETFIVTHTKQIESGVSVRNSGRMGVETYPKGELLIELFYQLRKEAKAYVFDHKRAQLEIFQVEETNKDLEVA